MRGPGTRRPHRRCDSRSGRVPSCSTGCGYVSGRSNSRGTSQRLLRRTVGADDPATTRERVRRRRERRTLEGASLVSPLACTRPERDRASRPPSPFEARGTRRGSRCPFQRSTSRRRLCEGKRPELPTHRAAPACRRQCEGLVSSRRGWSLRSRLDERRSKESRCPSAAKGVPSENRRWWRLRRGT